MFCRDQALRHVKCPRKIGPPFGHGQKAAAEVSLEHRSLHGAVPSARNSAELLAVKASYALRLLQVIGRQRPPCAHFFERPTRVIRMLLQKALEAPGTRAVNLHAVAEQRPDFYGYDARF